VTKQYFTVLVYEFLNTNQKSFLSFSFALASSLVLSKVFLIKPSPLTGSAQATGF
jgi:hypothetical protein